MLGIERPSGGSLVVNGHDLVAMSPKMLPSYRRQIGTVFQDHQLLNDRSVFDNVALPLEISGLDPREGKRRVRAALDKVGLLSKEKMSPMALSGGEQQRVGIARAVVNTPRIILADEPTGNLDPELSAEIMALFAQFMSVGVSLLVASHDRALIDGLGYRILTLEEGRLSERSEPLTSKARPRMSTKPAATASLKRVGLLAEHRRESARAFLRLRAAPVATLVTLLVIGIALLLPSLLNHLTARADHRRFGAAVGAKH